MRASSPRTVMAVTSPCDPRCYRLTNQRSNRGAEKQRVKEMSCRPSCMLAHDLANKLSAVVSHCDLIELEIDPSSSTYKHSEKIRQLAFQMNDLLHTRECERKPAFSAEADELETLLLA